MTSNRFRAPLALRLILPATLLLAGCGGKEAPVADAGAPASATDHAEDGIPWFQGSVEEAFALAKQERRPVFLYWGAVWCPPCHALRTRLFTRPEFARRLSETVAVYLDGDTERAQIWGEKLGTYGYPTVIVFDADGQEVTRIASLLAFEEYAEVLSRALDATRPIREVVAAAESGGPASLPPAELNLLAFYSFGQDRTLDLDDARSRALFERLWRETPADRPVEKTRFFSLYLQTLAGEEDAQPLSPAERDELAAGLTALLADRAAVATNFDLVLYGAGDVVRRLAPEPGPDRDALVDAWVRTARTLEADETLTVDDRLSALLPQIEISLLDRTEEGATPPADLQARVRERVRWAAGTVTDENEMQAVMSTMAGLLEDAGLADEARTLLAEKLGTTVAPYYYQSWLGGLEAKAGNNETAVARYREAWQGARATHTGAAMTPFRWGYSYLSRVLSLTPEASAAVRDDGSAVLADLLASPDAFAGGNWSRLEALASKLDSWAGEDPARGEVVDALRNQVRARCDRFDDAGEDSAQARCRSFLAGEPSA
ncbi:MAG: thioredoxin family protein [Acidobacteria bacterium]|nr:thioredoxin family protein [Acidobacteriota bacterium]